MNEIDMAINILNKIQSKYKRKHLLYILDRYEHPMKDINIFSGAFRHTIVPSQSSFVIKTMREEYTGSEDFEIELDIYKKAQEQNLAVFFAKPMGSFMFHNIKFFLFEKVTNTIEYGERMHVLPELPASTANIYCDELSYIQNTGLALKLTAFIEANHIGDLHNENIGYVLPNYSIKIIDYSYLY